MSTITVLTILISAAFGSAAGRNRKLQICGDQPSEFSIWIDSSYAQAHKHDGHTAGNVFCYFAEQCGDLIRTQINSVNLNMPNRTIQFKIYVDTLGKIYDATWADSGMPERSLPQLFNSFPSNTMLKQQYSNGILSGSTTTDSAGLISYLFIEKFTPKKNPGNFISTKRASDSIAHVANRSPKSILEVIRANIGKFQQIYQDYLKSNPTISGKISLKFTINPQGRIISISKISSSSQCNSMDNEIIEAAKLMKFEEVPFGNVTVTYAFVLDKQ